MLHGATIPDAAAPGLRVVNSMMLVRGLGEPVLDEASEEARFLARADLDG